MFKRRTSLLHRTLLVNLCTGNALNGVCSYESGTALILRGVTVHIPDSDPAPADGEVLIDRANVDFIQIL